MGSHTQPQEEYLTHIQESAKKGIDSQMTSSTVSTLSSLPSPVDSGFQVDSECELTSAATSNISDSETINTNSNTDLAKDNVENSDGKSDLPSPFHCDINGVIDEGKDYNELEAVGIQGVKEKELVDQEPLVEKDVEEFTESDFLNKNVLDANLLSRSVPNYFEKFFDQNKAKESFDSSKTMLDEVFEMEHPLKSNTDVDVMNLSLNSYELLDYTAQNANLQLPTAEADAVDLHVSMSEEVNENLKVIFDGKEAPQPIIKDVSVEKPDKPAEEQIVFRRQRKKKSKSDTPKKRVSFHEDILNSTKIDDIHINLGFITHEPDVSMSLFQRGFLRKPDVVKGRYSWAAEGDTPFYEQPDNRREIKSDIYPRNARVSSSSSSSTGSISSSIDEDSGTDENVPKKEPSLKQPKSSCLKKHKHKKYMDTNIVQEEIPVSKKKSESNLIDSTIFGSLKNIISFSTSVPLAERGIPEGQEDVAVYSSSHETSNRRKSFVNLPFQSHEVAGVAEVKVEPVSEMQLAKTNFKLTKSEGFYPNYPNQEVPGNIILCDSNVYEHKGISYSYEYDNFQKSFEPKKPKASMMYQRILKEFNFFRRKAKEPDVECEEDFEIINDACKSVIPEIQTEEVLEVEVAVKEIDSAVRPNVTISQYGSTTSLEWSENDTMSESSKCRNSRHLDSPKRKVRRNNHYTIQSPFKVTTLDAAFNSETNRSWPNLRSGSSSKSSLINQFLKSVTLRKMLDLKSQANLKLTRGCMGLYPSIRRNGNVNNKEIDAIIEEEVIMGKTGLKTAEPTSDMIIINLKKQLFKDDVQQVLKVFQVRTAYTIDGDSRAVLLVLSRNSLYVVSSKQNSTFSTHFVLYYTELNAVLIGPNAQTIHFSNYDLDMQCTITTGCSQLTCDIISQLEYAMRVDKNKPRLPSVKLLNMRDMANLRAAICKQTAVASDEEYYYYGIVQMQDFVTEEVPVSLGLIKEGPLMFKSSESDSGRWETAYFILKAGVLYMLSSASQRVPMRVFPLINGACQGARRVFNSHRPHTFQLIINGNTLLLAAPDEYVASEWLQELIVAANGIHTRRDTHITQSCSLLMTSDHILSAREAFPTTSLSFMSPKTKNKATKGPYALSCAAITDLVAFRLPSSEQSWCILEFSCREVHEYSGDWIIYFSTNAELETFIATLEMLWLYSNDNEESFPLSTIPETDPLSIKCMDTYKSLIEHWPTNTVHLQFM